MQRLGLNYVGPARLFRQNYLPTLYDNSKLSHNFCRDGETKFVAQLHGPCQTVPSKLPAFFCKNVVVLVVRRSWLTCNNKVISNRTDEISCLQFVSNSQIVLLDKTKVVTDLQAARSQQGFILNKLHLQPNFIGLLIKHKKYLSSTKFKCFIPD